MPATAVAATRLPWLAPAATSLVALARAAPGLWSQVGGDPGLVLLLCRESSPGQPRSPSPSSSSSLLDANVLEGALHLLSTTPAGVGFVDWRQTGLESIYQHVLRYARLAHALAQRSERCLPDIAWVGGLLAPLGWLAVAAADGDKARQCLDQPQLAAQPVAIQQAIWGMDQSAIARRVCRNWRQPAWIAAVSGHLGLPLSIIQNLDVEPGIFLVVQLAVALAQKQEPRLCLPVGGTIPELSAALGLSLSEVNAALEDAVAPVEPLSDAVPPWSLQLLPDLLRVAADNRRMTGQASFVQLENDLDTIHQALVEQHAAQAARLHAEKMTSLAELAAGAGHEINNPLAVISGRAQYLLSHQLEWFTPQADPNVRQSLQTIINQAQRIHQVLTDLMQFAKPNRPHRQLVDVAALLREVAASFHELAERRQVRVLCTDPNSPVTLYADVAQIRTALRCIARNAVEAAPTDGWARLAVQSEGESVRFIVEDNGKGPSPDEVPHLFDPFYSGRQAGRGRGLGLPVAWRLAREHGGDVTLAESLTGPTRFVLTLPSSQPDPEPAVTAPAPESGPHLLPDAVVRNGSPPQLEPAN
jgi:two-component system, NtrC family, sensor kinase